MAKGTQKKVLVGPWRNLHGAIWLIGLAILFFSGQWWPGILVLAALSMALEGIIMVIAPHAFQPEDQPLQTVATPQPLPTPPTPAPVIHRTDLLPSTCPRCGAPVRPQEVKWTSAQTADCSYCGSNLTMG
jgi:hypothetical protein